MNTIEQYAYQMAERLFVELRKQPLWDYQKKPLFAKSFTKVKKLV